MRTVSDIIEACQESQPATEQELRLALLCLYYDSHLACPSDYEGAGELKLRVRAKDNFERRLRMLWAAPDEYLGPRWTPGTQENAEARAQSKAILAAFENRRDYK